MYNHQLDAFVKVAELGSFNKAAEAMFISSTAVIQQVNLLEASCGFALFTRSHRGVKLTAAGTSFFEDAKTIIRLSEDALGKARKLADAAETTVRVGTSLLFKCRMIPDIWTKVSERCPELKIELIPIRERLGGAQKLTLDDLNGEYLVMPISNVSRELDDFRAEVTGRYPTVQIIDSSYYGLDTFTMCELNPYVLITQPVYSDIHPNLVSIPLETEYALPYGLVYSVDPSPAVRKFIQAAKKLLS
ncbi:MAG: LysR family transcriptional regulator [Oscillospiraceae bacterium]|nr:LysR family transcriptional regulator [Oscillospiraceae bacterium]